MIDQNPDGGSSPKNEIVGDTDAAESHLTEIAFPSQAGTGNKYRPNGNYVRVAYTKETRKGGIIVPMQAKPMDFVLVTVLDVGPDTKGVEKGDRVLVAMKGIINGEQGVMIDGEQTWWTQSNLIVTVVQRGASAGTGQSELATPPTLH